jgi:hypothetical protein
MESNGINQWADVLQNSFQEVLGGVLEVLPNIVIAILVILLGWIIGAALSKVVSQIFKSLKIDKALSASGLDELVEKGGFKLDSGKFVGELVNWFVIVVFLISALDILGLEQVTGFLTDVVVSYIPQVIAAVLILLIAVVLAEALRRLVISGAKAAGLSSAGFLGSFTKWAIWVTGALAALVQLGIGVIFIQTLFTGIVAAIAISFGLAFGLGGKEAAATFLEKARKEISSRD